MESIKNTNNNLEEVLNRINQIVSSDKRDTKWLMDRISDFHKLGFSYQEILENFTKKTITK